MSYPISKKNVKFHVENYVSKNYCECCVVVFLIVYLYAKNIKSKINFYNSELPKLEFYPINGL